MAIPTERLYDGDKLNVWFALTSMLMLSAILWMSYVDYARPWHAYQDEYMAMQSTLAHLDYVATQQESARQIAEAAQAELEKAQEQVAKEDARRQALADELSQARQALEAKTNDVDAAKATLDGAAQAHQRAESNSGPADSLTRRLEQEHAVAVAALEVVLAAQSQAAQVVESASNIAQANPTLAALQEQLAKLVAEFDAVKIVFSAADAVIKVTASEYEHALSENGADDHHTHQALEQLDAEAEALEAFRLEKERIEDRQAEVGGALADLNLPVTTAQKTIDALQKTADDALTKDDQYGNWLVKSIINMPFLDFAAPKGTPSRYEVRQLVLPGVRQRLNYLETYTTDRCTTCHLGIDDPEYSQAILAARLEKSIPAINEIRTAQGVSVLPLPAVPQLVGADAPELEAGQVALHWDALAPDQRDDYFEALLQAVNVYLVDEGRSELRLVQPLLAHPDLDLFVNIDSPHPMKKMGCTVCHEGNPQETDFVLAAHTPRDHEQEQEWEHKYYDRMAGVPTATFELIEHYWDRPMLLNKHAEAGCVKCHSNVSDIGSFNNKPQGRHINRGEHLFFTSGCINCHLVQGHDDARRVGPHLTRLANKLQPGFTDRWILNPRDFRPSTWMPHFFLQENNGADSANEHDTDPILRTETEALAIRTYLFALSDDWQAEQVPPGLTGDVERGRDLFKRTGCLACHSNLAEFGPQWIPDHLQAQGGKTADQAQADFGAMTLNEQALYAWNNFTTDHDTVFRPEDVRFDPEQDYHKPVFTRFAPELSAIGSKVDVDWLYGWLRDPHAYAPDSQMPSLRLTEQEALDIAFYLASLKHDDFDDSAIESDARHSETADQMVFVLLSGQRSEQRSRRIMDDEGGALSALLAESLAKSPIASLAQERIAQMDLPTKRLMYLGNKMISHYGCYACHLIPGFETATRPGTELTTWAEKPIAQLDFAFFAPAYKTMRAKYQAEGKEDFEWIYRPEDEHLIRLAHGNEHQEIIHTHASFAYHKIRNPRIWDRKKIKLPYAKLKMPNFYFTEHETDALVTYLMARRPARVTDALTVDYDNSHLGAISAGRKLTRELNCVGCHTIEDNVATVQQYYKETIGGTEYIDEINAPPALRGEGAKIQPAWFFGFLHNVETLRPWLDIRMPTFTLDTEQTTALVQYFAALSGYESDGLALRLDAVYAHLEKTEQATLALGDGSQEIDDGGLPAGHDWYKEDLLRKHADYLGSYAVRNRLMRGFALDESRQSEKDLAKAFGDVLERTEFLRSLYDVPYPFVDSPRPLTPDERFGKGETLILEMGCLKCHVMGDPTLEGSNSTPSAPNLNLTFRRLRQEWVNQWLRNPAWIQPGTKMPQLFPDGHSAFTDYGDLRAEYETRFGATSDEQIDLILDYLYTAGLTNHTTLDPTVAAAAAAAEEGGDDEAFDEDEEFDEEEFDDE